MKKKIVCKLKWYFLRIAQKRSSKMSKLENEILFYIVNKLNEIEKEVIKNEY